MTTTKPEVPTLKLERTFNAKPEKLWAFHTDPLKYAKWLNPSGIDLVIHEWDMRVGGRVRFDMPQPDGNKNPQEGVIHELTPFTKIVSGDANKTFLLTTTFVPVDETHTKMIIEAQGVPVEWHAPATEGWGQTFDHLERELSKGRETPAGGFTIVRDFKAAPEKVWQMWTTKDGLQKWWGAGAREMGYEFTVKELDVKPGGKYAFGMKGNGHDLTNHGTYTIVHPAGELGWTWHFDIFLGPDEKPYDVAMFLNLERLPNGGTRMRFTQGPLATPEHTQGSKEGVELNFKHLSDALGE